MSKQCNNTHLFIYLFINIPAIPAPQIKFTAPYNLFSPSKRIGNPSYFVNGSDLKVLCHKNPCPLVGKKSNNDAII